MLFSYMLIFAIANRIRGGGISVDKLIEEWFGIHIPFIFRSKCVFSYIVFGITYLLTGSIPVSIGVGTGMFLWALDGWGAYFLTGTYADSFVHYDEVIWIDWVLAFLFNDNPIRSTSSSEWTLFPFPCRLPRPSHDNVEYPFSEQKRSLYETIGMTLRGTHISYLSIFLCFFFNTAFALWLIPLGMMLGPIYYFARRVGFAGDTTALAEICAGSWYGLIIYFVIGIIS